MEGPLLVLTVCRPLIKLSGSRLLRMQEIALAAGGLEALTFIWTSSCLIITVIQAMIHMLVTVILGSITRYEIPWSLFYTVVHREYAIH